MGSIKEINADMKEITIQFDFKDVVYDFDELDEIVLAYATTIHKAQRGLSIRLW